MKQRGFPHVCTSSPLTKRVLTGNATNGLPKSLQGVFWQDGVILPEQAISTAGVWDPAQRKLSLNVFDSRVWALHDTSSEKKLLGGLLWLPSGAAHYNYIQATAPAVDIYFNEVRYPSIHQVHAVEGLALSVLYLFS